MYFSPLSHTNPHQSALDSTVCVMRQSITLMLHQTIAVTPWKLKVDSRQYNVFVLFNQLGKGQILSNPLSEYSQIFVLTLPDFFDFGRSHFLRNCYSSSNCTFLFAFVIVVAKLLNFLYHNLLSTLRLFKVKAY
jgi:hypothetical protein